MGVGWGAASRVSSWAHTLGCGFIGRLLALISVLRGAGGRKAQDLEAFSWDGWNTERRPGSSLLESFLGAPRKNPSQPQSVGRQKGPGAGAVPPPP
jgi:hypothetical protein